MTAKKERLLNFIIIFSAAFTFLCYFFYLLGGTVLSDSGGLFVVLFVFLGTTLPIIFSKQIKKILKKAYPILKMIYCAGLCLYMIQNLLQSCLSVAFSLMFFIDHHVPDVIFRNMTSGT